MAERRMFAKTIIDSDAFIDMPTTSRLLYYDLSMRADDDGFINNPKKIARMTNASDDDLKVLIGKNFLIPFENGVVVIKHWKIHNYIRADRYKPTVYQEELALLNTKENKGYTLGIPNDNQMETQVRLGKVRLGKVSIKRFKKPTLEEIQEYIKSRNSKIEPNTFYDFYESKGWKIGNTPMKDWKACIRTWENKKVDVKKRGVDSKRTTDWEKYIDT